MTNYVASVEEIAGGMLPARLLMGYKQSRWYDLRKLPDNELPDHFVAACRALSRMSKRAIKELVEEAYAAEGKS